MEDTYCKQYDEMVSDVCCKNDSHFHIKLILCGCGCEEYYDVEEYCIHR